MEGSFLRVFDQKQVRLPSTVVKAVYCARGKREMKLLYSNQHAPKACVCVGGCNRPPLRSTSGWSGREATAPTSSALRLALLPTLAASSLL